MRLNSAAMYAVPLKLPSSPMRRPIIESSANAYKRVRRSLAVIAATVGRGAHTAGPSSGQTGFWPARAAEPVWAEAGRNAAVDTTSDMSAVGSRRGRTVYLTESGSGAGAAENVQRARRTVKGTSANPLTQFSRNGSNPQAEVRPRRRPADRVPRLPGARDRRKAAEPTGEVVAALWQTQRPQRLDASCRNRVFSQRDPVYLQSSLSRSLFSVRSDVRTSGIAASMRVFSLRGQAGRWHVSRV